MNFDLFRKLVENDLPSSKYITRDDNFNIDLRYVRNLTDVYLVLGYVIKRHMQNDDLIIFNRQPSLHKM